MISPPLVTLFFIFPDDENKTDETLMITPMEENYYGRDTDVFVLSFRGSPRSHFTFYFNRHQTMEYLDTLLNGMSYDLEPYAKVQVTSAIFPSILYKVRGRGGDNLLINRDVRESILDIVYRTLVASPQVYFNKTERSRHETEDD